MTKRTLSLSSALVTALDESGRLAVLGLVERVRARIGTDPLSDDGLAALSSVSRACYHGLLRRSDGELVAYLQLRATSGTAEAVMEENGAYAPAALGLLDAMRAEHRGPVRLWIRGDHDPARRLVRGSGAVRIRELWRMNASLAADGPRPPEPPPIPSGFTIRCFEPGRDDQDWLAANRVAFADLPDQGDWSDDDLAQRLSAGWFRADGFHLLIAHDDSIVGFHWTKIHDSGTEDAENRLGEVYTLAVLPTYRGRGLGKRLMWVGLEYLRREGVDVVTLYVDSTNESAVRTYEQFGFERTATDRQYLIAAPEL